MGNEIKRGIKVKLASGLKRAGGFADETGTNAKKVAGKVADRAVKARDSVDAKIRAGLDEAYAVKRKAAIENVARLRKAHPEATPADIIAQLERSLKGLDKRAPKRQSIASAASGYVLEIVEVYGDEYSDVDSRRNLIDAAILIDSKTAKFVAKVAGVAVTALLARFGKAGAFATIIATPIVKRIIQAKRKVAKLGPFLSLLDVENPGKRSVSFVVISATRKALGEPPKSWPTESAPKTAATKSVKAAKPKTTAK